jgi:hypothetical protein
MKIKSILLSMLAVAATLTACNKAGDNTEAADPNAKKSVSVTIANQTAATRAVDSKTDAATAVANASDLFALFVNGAGTVVDVRKFADVAAADIGAGNINVEGQTYTFHQVPATTVKVAITDYDEVTKDESTLADVAAAMNDLSSQQGSLDDVLVYGESTKFEHLGVHHTNEGGIDYDLYDAGSITVVPFVARLEILGIGCANLGDDNEPDFSMYESLTLRAIGLNKTARAIGGTALDYGVNAGDVWATDRDANKWNIDSFTATIDATTKSYNSQVFAYHVAPGAVPSIVLEVSAAEWNDNIAEDMTVNPPIPMFVKSTGLKNAGGTAIAAFEAGKIYQVNYAFACEDVKTWDEDDEFVCVDVKVIIPEWTVVGDLTTTFE